MTHTVRWKRMLLDAKFRRQCWLLGRWSPLPSGAVSCWRTIPYPIPCWPASYCFEELRTAPNIYILERFEAEVLRAKTDTSSFVTNTDIHGYIKVLVIKEFIAVWNWGYLKWLDTLLNVLAINLSDSILTNMKTKMHSVTELTLPDANIMTDCNIKLVLVTQVFLPMYMLIVCT